MFSAYNMLNLFDDVIAYVQNEPIFTAIIAICVLGIIIVCVILAVSGKKAKKNAADATQTVEESAQIAEESAQTPLEATPTEGDLTPPTEDVEPLAVDENISPAEDMATQPVDAAPAEDMATQPVDAAPAEDVATQPVDAAPAEDVATQPVDAAPAATATEEPEDVAAVDEPKDASATEELSIAQAPVEENKKAYAGKWVLSKVAVVKESGEEADSAYFFQLKASNGESLLTSEEYTSLYGATGGIETYKANISKGNFKISISKKGKYIVKLLTNTGALLTQGEKYATRSQALSAIASIKRFAETAVISEEMQETRVLYEETPPAAHDYDPTKKGKWCIQKTVLSSEKDCSYRFELRASNGQVLFTSEEYCTLANLKNGIKTHKRNIENGNIKAAITRNGEYILKIYTANGQLLCLGEHYKTKQLCLNAIESVKRFSQSAKLNLDNLFFEQ